MSNNRICLVELRDVACSRGDSSIAGVTLWFDTSSVHILRGESASLLLRIATLLELPDAGVITLVGESVQEMDEGTRTTVRSRAFGFVFDAPYLLPELSVAENIAMPLFKVLDLDAAQARERTESMLRFAALEPLATARAGELARFDQQRVALARAIAHHPVLLALDHADANLAANEAAELLRLARRARSELGIAVVVRCAHQVEPLGDECLLSVTDGCVRIETDVVREQTP